MAGVGVNFELTGSKYLLFSTFSVSGNWVLRLKMTLEPCVENGDAFEAQALEKLWRPFRHTHFPHRSEAPALKQTHTIIFTRQ